MTARETAKTRRGGTAARRLEARVHRERALLDPLGGAGPRRRGRRRAGRRARPPHRGRASRGARGQSRRVRRRGLRRHDQRGPRRRPRRHRRRVRGVRSLDARRRRVRRCGPRRPERAPPLRRHRAGGQLHRRPAQVAVRALRLLRPGLPASPSSRAPCTRSTRATSTTSTANRGTPPTSRCTSAGARAGLPLWFSLATHGTDRYRDAVELSLATARIGWPTTSAQSEHLALVSRARAVGRGVRATGLDARAVLRPGRGRPRTPATMLCVPTKWRGRTVLRLAFVNPETDPERVIEILGSLALDAAARRARPARGTRRPAGAPARSPRAPRRGCGRAGHPDPGRRPRPAGCRPRAASPRASTR